MSFVCEEVYDEDSKISNCNKEMKASTAPLITINHKVLQKLCEDPM